MLTKYLVFFLVNLFLINFAHSAINYQPIASIEVGKSPVKIFKIDDSNDFFVVCLGQDADFDSEFDQGEEFPSIWKVTFNPSTQMYLTEKKIGLDKFFKYPVRPAIDKSNKIIYLPLTGVVQSYSLEDFQQIDSQVSNIDASGLDYVAGHLLISTNDSQGNGKLVVLNLASGQVLQTINLGVNLQETIYYPGKQGISIASLAIGSYGSDSSKVYYGAINHTFDFDLSDSVIVGNTANHLLFNNGKLYVTVNMSHIVMEIDLETHFTRTFHTGTSGFSGPRESKVDGDYLFVTTYAGDIRAINLLTGVLESIFPIEEFNISEGLEFISSNRFAVAEVFDFTYSPVSMVDIYEVADVNYSFKSMSVGFKPVWISNFNDKIQVICAGNDANANKVFDNGDENPSWWEIDNGIPIKKFEFDFNSVSIPFNPAIDSANKIMYIAKHNLIKSYNIDEFDLVDDQVSNINTEAIDYAGGHLLIAQNYENNSDSIAVLNLKNGLVLQKIYAGEEVGSVKYFPYLSDGKPSIGLAVTTFLESESSWAILYGPISHMQDFKLENKVLIDKPYNLDFDGTNLKVVAKDGGVIYLLNPSTNNLNQFNIGANGELGPTGFIQSNKTNSSFAVSTYNGDVRLIDKGFSYLYDISPLEGKAEYIIDAGKGLKSNFVIASSFNLDASPNDKVYYQVSFPTTVNESKLINDIVKIYPNPASVLVNIEIPKKNYNISSLTIYSLDGKLIDTYNLPSLTNSISVDNLQTGTYLISLNLDNNFYTIPLNIIK